MDLSTLNLSSEQMTALEGHIAEEVTKTKEGFKDFISKEDSTKLIQKEIEKVKTEHSKKVKTLEDELIKYKPSDKTPEQIELEKRVRAIEDRENEVKAKEKLMDISDKLKDQKLPKEFAKYLVGVENEKIETEIINLKELFNKIILDNSFKPEEHKSNKNIVTKEQFKKMSYMDRMNLFKNNQELYTKLSK